MTSTISFRTGLRTHPLLVLSNDDDDDNDDHHDEEDDDEVVDGGGPGEEDGSGVGGGIRPRRGVDDGEAEVGSAVEDGVEGGAQSASVPSAQSALSPPLSLLPPTLPPCLLSSPPAPEESHPRSSSFSSSHQSLCDAYSDWPSVREKISFDDKDDAEVDRPPACG